MSQIAVFADFRANSEGEAGENNSLERAEYDQKQADRPIGEVRKFPQESAQTRGNWRDQTRKNPNREWLGVHYWWDGVYHTKMIST